MGRRGALLMLGGLLALSVGWLVLGAGSPRPRGGEASQSDTPLPSGSVMIVVVKSRDAVREVREAVDPERIVANSLDGFALREGRLVVSSVEAAGGLLELAGWAEASLEIVKPPPREHFRAAPLGAASPPAGELSALLARPTLTPAEALRALQLLE